MDRRLVAALFLAGLALCALPACHAEVVDMTDSPKVTESPAGDHVSATDVNTAAREKESLRRHRSGEVNYQFQAEVNRLMDILIHSLYSNKDIFLRELISNASDALDKIRFMSLTDKAVLGEGDDAALEIRMSLDKANKVIYIRDRGIGMTKEDLIKNLGTIAKSGTSAFLEQVQKSGDMNLIGQFGVGFYSVYLVADWVEVISKHNDDKQYIWSSSADGSFSISEDTENAPLGRGTLIKIHLKEEAQEYADEGKLKDLVSKYSEFINFPIFMEVEKEVEVPVEEAAEEKSEEAPAEEKKEEEEEEADEDDVEDDDEEEESKEGEEDKPKNTKKVKRMEWDLLNDNKAIWLRKPADVTTEEYQKFYKAVSKDYSDALSWSHFKAEGDVEFKSILYIPKVSPYDFYDKYYEKGPRGVKLYVRRVFISDDFEDLIPRYLGFIKGIVDSDSLPLNVSREMLQAHAALKTMKKKLVRKILDMIRKLAEDEKKCKDPEVKEEDKPGKDECEAYKTFWDNFGRAMKLGVIEDATNRGRLAKLLRFHTSKFPDTLTSLDEYVGRMKDGQKQIYYLAGSSKDEIAKSPFLEKLLRKGYEVIYFTDVLDEYVMQHMLDYDDNKFANASKEDLQMAEKDEQEKKEEKELKETFKDLTKWWKKALGDAVTNVKVSNRLATSPCVVVAGKYGSSANMERIMRAQAFSDPSRAAMQRSQKVLEINPRHPLIKALRDRVSSDEADPSALSSAKLLYQAAVLESGFLPEDPKDFSQQLHAMLKDSVLKIEEPLEVPEEAEEVEEAKPAEAEEVEEAQDAKDEL